MSLLKFLMAGHNTMARILMEATFGLLPLEPDDSVQPLRKSTQDELTVLVRRIQT